MQPLIIGYLKTHSLQQLEDDHGVCARFSNDLSKVSLNYDQILIKNGDPLAEQCRGMVVRPTSFTILDGSKIDVVGECELLAWPMDRFYNAGDCAAATIDWSDPGLRVYEKLDGTMVVAYWDPLHRRWSTATRGVPEADLPIRKDHIEIGDMTFSDLFFWALRETRKAGAAEPINWVPSGIGDVIDLDNELTYVFELTAPYNRVVVRYDRPRVTLLAARRTATGEELEIESLKLQHVPRPKTWPIRSVVALAAFVDAADPALLEGAVVCDSMFRRLKVKNKTWIVASRAKDMVTVSRRSALEAILTGKVDDIIPLLDHDVGAELLKMQASMKAYFKQIDVKFASWRAEAGGSRKTFAGFVVASGDWTPAYFALWDARATSALQWAVGLQASGKLSAANLDTILNRMQAF